MTGPVEKEESTVVETMCDVHEAGQSQGWVGMEISRRYVLNADGLNTPQFPKLVMEIHD